MKYMTAVPIRLMAVVKTPLRRMIEGGLKTISAPLEYILDHLANARFSAPERRIF